MQHPRFGLRIGLFEVGKKGSVRQVLKPGGIVGHDVGRSWEAEASMAVAMLALVRARLVAQECCWAVAADSAFVESRDGGNVVIPGQNRGARDVVVLGQDGRLSLGAGLLQVTVGDGPVRVVSRHELTLDF